MVHTGTDGSIRLEGGLISTEGNVQVCVNGEFAGVCDSDWDYKDAFVVCRELGYPATGTSCKVFKCTVVIH